MIFQRLKNMQVFNHTECIEKLLLCMSELPQQRPNRGSFYGAFFTLALSMSRMSQIGKCCYDDAGHIKVRYRWYDFGVIQEDD